MLKVSPWKRVIRFGKRGKLNPRYIGPFKIIAKGGTVAYHLELPERLSRVHSMFHVSKLKKFMADEPLAIPLDEIQVDDKLHFIKELVEIMDREVKHLNQSRIPIIKVVLIVPRRHNLYNFNLTEIQPERDINCLLAKASFDESIKWHRRMAHVNFKNINKLAKHGLVNGLPTKLFTNEQNYRLFLAFASYMGFMVYQMDVKSAFLYGEIDEEVYVSQPKGFEDPHFPKHVYKVVKALYGLHQAPMAWYARLSTFLLKHNYKRGTIDKTLFIKKNSRDIILVQVYVDDIIFGSTKKAWCDEFEPDGILSSKTIMSEDILKKFDMEDPDMFPHVKKIFKYLKGQQKLGLWYLRDSPFVLEAYSDIDYAGSHGDRKSTTGGCQFLGKRLISWQCKKQTIVATSSTEAEYVAAANCCGHVVNVSSGGARVPTGSFTGSYWLTTSYWTPNTITEDTEWSHFNWVNDGRFLQIILGIETRNTKQYHVLKLSSKLFANMRLNFEGDHMPLLAAMLPPAQAAIADEGTGEAAPDVPQTIPETIQETRPEPDQSQEHIPTPPRPTTSDQIPLVFEQGHTSDPNIASFLGAHESDPDLFTSTNVEDETLGGSFHTTPPRSTQVPPVGPTSGGAEDLATLTALSSLVSELVQKVSTLESELKAHKLLFKDVVGKLVKKVKALELKLKTRSRKVVMSESDKEEEEEQDVDPLIKLAKAAAASDAHVDVSPGADIPPSPPLPTGMSAGVSSGVSTGTPAGTSNKGKSPIMEVDPPVKRRTFRQMEEDMLGEEAAKRLFEEEHADLERQRAEMTAVADLQSQNIRRTLKRAGEDLEHDVSKKPKPTKVPMLSQPDVPQQQATNVPPVDPQQPSESSSQPNVSMSSGPEKKGHTYGTKRKSLGTMKKSSTGIGTWNADDKFIQQSSF
ncbi:putative ribonuclease H-like domain-containing protein [Tanacetum coccineum]